MAGHTATNRKGSASNLFIIAGHTTTDIALTNCAVYIVNEIIPSIPAGAAANNDIALTNCTYKPVHTSMTWH